MVYVVLTLNEQYDDFSTFASIHINYFHFALDGK